METVLVGCKIPNGIVIQPDEMVDTYEPVMGGGQRKVPVARAFGPPIRLNGPSTDPSRRLGFPVRSGYAFTRVPKDAWERWFNANKNSSFFTERQVIVAATEAKGKPVGDAREKDIVTGMAKDFRDTRTGLEQMKRGKGDPRDKPVLGPQGSKIEIEEESEDL